MNRNRSRRNKSSIIRRRSWISNRSRRRIGTVAEAEEWTGNNCIGGARASSSGGEAAILVRGAGEGVGILAGAEE